MSEFEWCESTDAVQASAVLNASQAYSAAFRINLMLTDGVNTQLELLLESKYRNPYFPSTSVYRATQSKD